MDSIANEDVAELDYAHSVRECGIRIESYTFSVYGPNPYIISYR